MDSRVHVIIAVIAAFAGGEVAGIVTVLLVALRRRTPPLPPRRRQELPGGAQVIPFTRARGAVPLAAGSKARGG